MRPIRRDPILQFLRKHSAIIIRILIRPHILRDQIRHINHRPRIQIRRHRPLIAQPVPLCNPLAFQLVRLSIHESALHGSRRVTEVVGTGVEIHFGVFFCTVGAAGGGSGGGADKADYEGVVAGYGVGLVRGAAGGHDCFAEHVGLALAPAADGGAGVAAEEGHGFSVSSWHRGGGGRVDFVGLLAGVVAFLGCVVFLRRG